MRYTNTIPKKLIKLFLTDISRDNLIDNKLVPHLLIRKPQITRWKEQGRYTPTNRDAANSGNCLTITNHTKLSNTHLIQT